MVIVDWNLFVIWDLKKYLLIFNNQRTILVLLKPHQFFNFYDRINGIHAIGIGTDFFAKIK